MLSSREKQRKNKNRDQKSENKKEETSLSKKISDLAESAMRFFTKKKARSKDSESKNVCPKYATLSNGPPKFVTRLNLLILFRPQTRLGTLNVQRENRFLVLKILVSRISSFHF